MASLVKSGNTAHDAACLAALVVYHGSVAGAPMNAAGQLQINNAELAFHRAVVASCRANNNNVGMEASLSALKLLGVNS